MNFLYTFLLLIVLTFSSCTAENKQTESKAKPAMAQTTVDEATIPIPFDTSITTIHIMVALADNKYQWIAPVPARIGNGQDPKNNLYWGAAYGIKTFFKRSGEWTLIKTIPIDTIIYERLVFKHRRKNCYLIADAYNGKYIRRTIEHFLRSSAGQSKDTLQMDTQTIGIDGNADLLAYIGHDGLMDFRLDEKFLNRDQIQRDVIILSCYSRDYFGAHLQHAHVNPLVWTSGLMAPEAYTIHDAISAYLEGASEETIRLKAAQAYHRYQKCGLRGARNLLVGGWQ